MSIRYSGDAEVRLGFDKKRRVYRGTAVDRNGLRYPGEISAHAERDPTSPEAYDRAARKFFERAMRKAKQKRKRFAAESRNGRLVIRRGYQSPCPLEE